MPLREQWFNAVVPNDYGGWDWLSESYDRFCRDVSTDTDRLVWIAPADAAELTNLHWYLDQFGDVEAKMIIADYPLRDAWQGGVPRALGTLDVAAMADLLDNCPRTDWDRSRFPRDRWTELVADDALLRIIDGPGLRSAAPDYFDEILIKRCPAHWRGWTRVMGETMGAIWDIGQHADDQFILWRLLVLIEQGAIEGNGMPYHLSANPENRLMVRRAI